MKLFLVSRPDPADYDEYDAFVVAAPDAATARWMYPMSGAFSDEAIPKESWQQGCWVKDPETLSVAYLGEARDGMPQGVVLASFNAG
jgi:hypothetical protein